MSPQQKRLNALRNLSRPLIILFLGVSLLSIGVAYFTLLIYRSIDVPAGLSILLLQFLPIWARGLLFVSIGLIILGIGIWNLSDLAIIPIGEGNPSGELVVGMDRAHTKPRIVVISGGAGMLILASLGRRASSLICVTPVQEPVEYYYRASSMLRFEHVLFVAPTPEPIPVEVTLDDGQQLNIKHSISHDERLARRHVQHIALDEPTQAVTQVTLDSIRKADVIILGPGSLFESILPYLLIPTIQEAIIHSKARKIYICSLMTEPGLTTGFGVGDHIRKIKEFGGFTPDYVLVNAARIDPDVRRIYADANQTPITLSPEEYEETIVRTTNNDTQRDVLVDGAVVIEVDLASSVVQLTASLDKPDERRTVRVLRHDPEKLAAVIEEILRR